MFTWKRTQHNPDVLDKWFKLRLTEHLKTFTKIESATNYMHLWNIIIIKMYF